MLKARLDQDGSLADIINYEDKINELLNDKKLELVDKSIDDDIMGVISRKKEERRTIADLKKIVLREKIDKKYDELIKKIDEEYFEFIPQHEHNLELGEFDEAGTYIEMVDDKIYQRWRIFKNNPGLIRDKIEKLKQELASTDYIVIKAYEAKLSMSDSPYSKEELDKTIEHRQALRNKINELEELIK